MATGRVPTTANSPLTAKGDLFGYSTTQARVAVGNDGETLVADSSTSTGLRYQGNFAAGKNKIINGDFGIWQRGTSFNSSTLFYTADRWAAYSYSGASQTVSQQAFTAGSAPVAGYEAQYFLRATATNTGINVEQRIEDVRTYAGQTVTLSFWAKSNSAQTITTYINQNFGSGGSTQVTGASGTQALTTSWTRFTLTGTLPSMAGKTIGSSSYLQVNFVGGTINNAVDIWGVQLEAGSVATAFQTATGTIQGELAACQRYYWRASGQSTQYFGTGCTTTTSAAQIFVQNPVPMRVAPTSIDTSGLKVFDSGAAASATAVIGWNAPFGTRVDCSFTGLTANRPAFLFTDSTGHLGFSAEL